MHLGVVGDNPLESLALASGAVPEPVVLGAWGLFVSRVLLAAAKLGVFEALEAGPLDGAGVAAALGLHAEATERLLRTLNGMGYVSRADGRFALTKVSRKWLLSSSKTSMRDAVLFVEELWNWMAGLEDAVRTGQAQHLHDDGVLSPESWGRYLRGLAAFARPAGIEVGRRLRVRRPLKRLLDVGGGHGMYSVELCKRYPGLTSEVLDLPQAAVHGRAIVEQAGFAQRVAHREGDMRQVDWGGGYDGVLIFNVLHNATAEEAPALVKKAFDALEPGGVLAIQEAEYKKTTGNLSFNAGFGELFFFLVTGARTWPEATLRQWMEAAGFEGVQTKRLWLVPSALVCGYKPGA